MKPEALNISRLFSALLRGGIYLLQTDYKDVDPLLGSIKRLHSGTDTDLQITGYWMKNILPTPQDEFQDFILKHMFICHYEDDWTPGELFLGEILENDLHARFIQRLKALQCRSDIFWLHMKFTVVDHPATCSSVCLSVCLSGFSVSQSWPYRSAGL